MGRGFRQTRRALGYAVLLGGDTPILVEAIAATRGMAPGPLLGGATAFSNGTDEVAWTTTAFYRAGPSGIPAGTMKAVCSNWTNNGAEQSGLNAIRVRPVLHRADGTLYGASAGLQTVAIDENRKIAIPNPDIAPYEGFFIRTDIEVDAGGKVPLTRPLSNVLLKPDNLPDTRVAEGSNRKNYSYSQNNVGTHQAGTVSVLANNNTAGSDFAPTMILGMVPANELRIETVGTSIPSGVNDDRAYYVDREIGGIHHFVARFRCPYLAVTRSSGTMFDFNSASPRRQALIEMARCTMGINELGTNDNGNATTFANFRDNGSIATWFRQYGFCGGGRPIFGQVMDPRTTVANDASAYGTGSIGEAIWLADRDWKRDGAPLNPVTRTGLPVGTAPSATCVRAGQAGHPLVGILDALSMVENSANPLLWTPAYNPGDGVHRNQPGHALWKTFLPDFVPTWKASPVT